MEDAIRKAAALTEAMPYILAFRDKIFVIKFGGAAMEDKKAEEAVLRDVLFLAAVGIHPVLVHGGGPEISREMKAHKIEPRFIRGHRVTDEATLKIVQDVLANRINAGICRRLKELGGDPVPFADPSTGTLTARRRAMQVKSPDGKTETIDLGFVGDVEGIAEGHFRSVLSARKIAVVAPIASGANGETLNVNADMVAGHVAAGLRAEKAVFLTDTHGILTNATDASSFAETLTEKSINDLVHLGVIDGGMLPKVEACLVALKAGVRKTHIIDGRIPHSLLLEIFTDRGVGTQIIH